MDLNLFIKCLIKNVNNYSRSRRRISFFLINNYINKQIHIQVILNRILNKTLNQKMCFKEH